MLSDFDIADIWAISNKAGSSYADFARAIEAAVRAEYGNVEPGKWKSLYKACRHNYATVVHYTLDQIDGGTYNEELAK